MLATVLDRLFSSVVYRKVYSDFPSRKLFGGGSWLVVGGWWFVVGLWVLGFGLSVR